MKKISILLLSISMLFINIIVPVHGKENDKIDLYSTETYTYSTDMGLGDVGYVTCSIQVRINTNTGGMYTLKRIC